MTEPAVVLERRDQVAVITLNVPRQRNVLSAELVQSLSEAYDTVERTADVRCVVLTGAGSAFCAGAELDTLESAAAGDFEPVRYVYEGFLRVLRSPLPTIGAINGPAVGAGFNLALACDIRLASATARFDTRFAALNLHPGGGHTWLLARAVGPQQAMLACLFGQMWNADAALDRGLISSVHMVDELVPAAIALGARLAELDGAYVRRLTSTLRLAAGGADHETVLAAETAAQQWSLGEPNFLVGLAGIRQRMADTVTRR